MNKVFFAITFVVICSLLHQASWAVDGAAIYKAKCSPCHGAEGGGTPMAPAFKGNSFIGGGSIEEISDEIRNGRDGSAKKYKQYALGMPRQSLDQTEILEMVRYLKKLSGYGDASEASTNFSASNSERTTVVKPADALYLPINMVMERALSGHIDGVYSVAFSPNGKILASGSMDRTVRLWDVSTGRLLRTLSGHTDRVISVAFSPDGKIIASGGDDDTVKLWDISTDRLFKTLSGHTGDVRSVAFSPEGKIIASGGYDDAIKLWDISTGRLLKTIFGHTEGVFSLAFSPEGKIIASGVDDNTIRLWDVSTGSLLKTLSGHTDSVLSVAFSPDGKTIASGSYDGTIKLWNVSTGSLLKTLSGHTDSVRSVAFSSNGEILASGSDDDTVKLWNVSIGSLLKTLSGNTGDVRSVAFSPDGEILAYDGTDKTLMLRYHTDFFMHQDIKKAIPLLEREMDEKLTEVSSNLFSAKGEFETTREYEERIRIAKAEEPRVKAGIRKEYEGRIKEIKDKAEKEERDRMSKLYPIGSLHTELGRYDADNERFEADLMGNRIFINVPREKAKIISQHKDKLTAEGMVKYVDDKKVELVNPYLVDNITNEKFAFGKHTDSVMVALGQKAPPGLKIANIKLVEPSGNGILDAGEQGSLKVVLRNEGKGPAFGVSLSFQTDKTLKGLSLNEKVYVGQINSGEEKSVEVDIIALENVETADLNVRAALVESNGFDSQPVIISFKIKELIPPLLQVGKVDIEDADGRRVITKGKEARVTLTVQNAGGGASKGVVVTAEPGDANIKLFGDSAIKIGVLSPGETKKAVFSVAVTTRYNGPKELPLHFAVKEERDRFSIKPDMKFVLNEEAPEVRVVKVEAKEAPSARMENIEDINTPPAFSEEQKIIGDKDLAVVIGIERYRKLPRAEYSYNDAKVVKGYLKAIGFAERNIKFLVDEEATLSGINSSIGTWLPNRTKRDSKVFIYYSGHGSPDPATGEAYLIPHDGDPNYLKDTGYPLKRLYENLGKLDAAEVAVVMDACFSGSGGRSVLAKGARPAVVVIEDPVLASRNIAVLSSTQGAQISTSFAEKEHGLFTYYFLKAIKDGKKDLAEIYSYIKPLIEDGAREQNVEQSPSLKPGPEMVKDRFGLRR